MNWILGHSYADQGLEISYNETHINFLHFQSLKMKELNAVIISMVILPFGKKGLPRLAINLPINICIRVTFE